jgi:hypothetical protein
MAVKESAGGREREREWAESRSVVSRIKIKELKQSSFSISVPSYDRHSPLPWPLSPLKKVSLYGESRWQDTFSPKMTKTSVCDLLTTKHIDLLQIPEIGQSCIGDSKTT